MELLLLVYGKEQVSAQIPTRVLAPRRPGTGL